MNRGLEIRRKWRTAPQSCVLEQVTNGIAVRMALLFLLMPRTTEDGERSVWRKRRRDASARERRTTDRRSKGSLACFSLRMVA